MTGAPASCAQAPVIVSNHMGVVEAAYLLARTGASAVTTVENSRLPLLCRIVRGLECIVVDRKASGAQDRVLEAIRERATSCTRPILIFPEGTTVNQTSVISFKRGAFVAGTPVQPVACRIAWTNTTGVDPAWVNDGPSQLSVLIRLMATWRNHMEVHFLPVHRPSKAEVEDPDLFADNVRRRIAAALAIPCTEYSFEDVWLGQQALRWHRPPSGYLLEWNAFRKVAPPFTREEARVLLIAFKSADTDENSVLRWAEFKDWFRPAQAPGEVEMWFRLLADETGGVSFRAFCLGYAALRGYTVLGDSMRVAYPAVFAAYFEYLGITS